MSPLKSSVATVCVWLVPLAKSSEMVILGSIFGVGLVAVAVVGVTFGTIFCMGVVR